MHRAALALVALAACLPPRYVRAYPRWQLVGNQHLAHGCLQADAFVRKSGKTGVGVALALRSLHDCDVRLVRAELVFPGGRRAAASADARALAPLVGRSLRYQWLPVPFDNDASWDRGERAATLELELAIAGEVIVWRMPAEHRFAEAWHDRWSTSP